MVFATEPVADGIVLITTVKETSPYMPSLSMALTQENGFEIGPSISSSNLFGTAARVSAYARFGGATNIGISYMDPQLPGMSLLFGHKFHYFRCRGNQPRARGSSRYVTGDNDAVRSEPGGSGGVVVGDAEDAGREGGADAADEG